MGLDVPGLVIGVSLGESHMMEYKFTQSTYFRYSEDKVESNPGSGTSCKSWNCQSKPQIGSKCWKSQARIKKIGEKIETYWLRRAKLMIILRIRPRNKKIWPGEIQNFENQEIHMVVHAPSRMTKSEEEGLLTIVTTFVSEIYFSIWFLESSCVDESEYVPNLPAAMNIFFTTSVQSENLTFLGVRSTNPLPAASGLVKLTRFLGDSYFLLYLILYFTLYLLGIT